MPVYRVFGLTFASDCHFAYQLPVVDGVAPDFTYTCAAEPPVPVEWPSAVPLYISPMHDDQGTSLLRVYHTEHCDVVRCAGQQDYYLFADRIVGHCPAGVLDQLETHLLSTVLVYWLERAGTIALHASAVEMEGAAVGFLSHSGNGKSGLAAALIAAGYGLLGDDILPLARVDDKWLAQPGFATMRMWPDEAEFFLGVYEPLPKVHPDSAKRRVAIGSGGWGTFCPAARPLACLFVPERRPPGTGGSEITITRLSPRNATIDLVRYSFAARLVQAAGLQAMRMERIAQLAQTVPMFRLRYPSGFEYLAGVADAVVAQVTIDL